MTAEVGILNKQGVVIAADSAVTIGGQRVYNTSNKVFILGKSHSVGLMTFGNAEFMNVPWQIIFKRFNNNIKAVPLKKLEDYAEKLIDFVRNDTELHDKASMINYVESFTYRICEMLQNDINSQTNPSMGEDKFKEITKNIILTAVEKNAKAEQLTIGYEYIEFDNSYKAYVENAIRNFSNNSRLGKLFLNFVLDSELFIEFKKLIYYFITQDKDVLPFSGIVVAGYGKDDIFPKLFSYKFYGNVDKHLVFKDDQKVKIAQTGLSGNNTAAIMPFAQQDVAATILNGMAPQFAEEFDKIFQQEGLSQKVRDDIFKRISNYQRANFIIPMINSVTTLTISELAEVAETLVNLTEFKRKYTSNLATVGGPIDILSITYNEGPIWIKQKHYFELKDNLDYILRRQK
ncbi:hypothetical protein N6G96_05930 [Pediococcus inopinatus]|uniref:Uncharacterized protein n=1 Tax=Pediococcus inopinatus TaxID=114090 RepID=A0ABZ0Q2U3_9LACO|nr:hypothetical protein [Pediococcus inopinatus]WPC20847.1 hypothetical protein N6G96_05930 [Pediococcus inopinatus]